MPGPQELIVIALILVLLFGAKKLPELARGTGRALRIFKAETQGLHDDDGDDEQAGAPASRQGELRTQAAERDDAVLDAEDSNASRPETRTER